MEPQRILWLTENYPPQRGGMAQSCDRIVDGLRKNGHWIDVLHFFDRGSFFQTILQVNGTYTPLPVDESEAHTLNLAWNFLQHKQARALVCFGGYLPILAAPVFSKWLSAPLITLLRGNDFDSAIFTPRKRDLLRDALEASEKVCVVSSDKLEKLNKLFPTVTATYIPNGIDTTAWIATPSEIEFARIWRSENCTQKLCLGLFGQLKAKKGIDFFINSLAATDFRKTAHVVLTGELSQEMIGMLEKFEISYTQLPFMDRYELVKYYLCCDAIAIPSHYDGMPNVLLEAGALGIPVLASRTGGMADVITENKLLFDPGNFHACQTVLHSFFESTSKQRVAWGAAIKLEIENKFNHTQETKHYEKVLDETTSVNRTHDLRMQSG